MAKEGNIKEVDKINNVEKVSAEKGEETLSPEVLAKIAAEKTEKAAKRKENIDKATKGIGDFLWKTVDIKILFIIIFAILMFAVGFYAGEENYKRVLKNDYEKAIEDFTDIWEGDWKDAFED